ncbi:uncharacterized protein LOC132626232 [Lycium barbarum]|uniref:uncharacterized protein LOC132626232 n=1 Tax=Lycium barbarum TaxID=112863 RepID=UPI00293E8D1A|nr:uncharacterized protein LOC132626232 [Lycium barbarum]
MCDNESIGSSKNTFTLSKLEFFLKSDVRWKKIISSNTRLVKPNTYVMVNLRSDKPQIVWQVKYIARMLRRLLGLASSTSFWSCAESCIDMYDYGYVRALS